MSQFVIAVSRAALAAAIGLALNAPQALAQAPTPADTSCGRQTPLRLAAQDLRTKLANATDAQAKARAAAALATVDIELNRFDEAEALLHEALDGLPQGRERAAAAIDLGNVLLARRRHAEADKAWALAVAQAPDDVEIGLAVELNRLRLPDAAQRRSRLQAAAQRVEALPDAALRARHALNVATQAKRETGGEALAWRMYDGARAWAQAARRPRLAAEAFDGLAELYAAQGRHTDALRLAEAGIEQAQRVDAPELLIDLEWRAGQMAHALARDDFALASYRRAVQHIEAVRGDIPVQYQDGRSSFRETLEPIYLGLTDLLLSRSAAEAGASRETLLRQARDTVELIKQSELQDFLRDRCAVESSRRTQAFVLPPATALYYPIILPDRLELLLETAQGIERQTVAVRGDALRNEVQQLVTALRARAPFQARAEAMYRHLLAPIEATLARQGIRTLIAVPDGVLRLLPLGALHDGHGFVIERLAVATVPGLTMTAAPQRRGDGLRTLLAGMSEPGPVVEKLSQDVVSYLLDAPPEPAPARTESRSIRGNLAQDPDPAAARAADRSVLRANALRKALALPGVKAEIEDIARVVPQAAPLLDRSFTLAALKEQLLAHDWRVVHLASHGVFGDSAEDTFIMTYDELLTLDGLQSLLGDQRAGKTPIDLITLSACQTAEGDDRAPLGMSGAALKARARSALGTLWPVADEAATRLMSRFYRLLAEGGHSKIDALRSAQVELIGTPSMHHPFYWAPFILIGDWQ